MTLRLYCGASCRQYSSRRMRCLGPRGFEGVPVEAPAGPAAGLLLLLLVLLGASDEDAGGAASLADVAAVRRPAPRCGRSASCGAPTPRTR
mgnify:CR=1 FL=1